MPPKTESTPLYVRILDRYGLPSAFLAIVLWGYSQQQAVNQTLNDRVLSAFVEQTHAAHKMSTSIDALTAEIRARK